MVPSNLGTSDVGSYTAFSVPAVVGDGRQLEKDRNIVINGSAGFIVMKWRLSEVTVKIGSSKMLGSIIFWLGLSVSLAIGFVYFRDLGDVSQMLIRVKRKDMIRFIRNEYRLLAIGLGALVLMTIVHFGFDAGSRVFWWSAILLCVILYGFPYIWVHVGLRFSNPGRGHLCRRSGGKRAPCCKRYGRRADVESPNGDRSAVP